MIERGDIRVHFKPKRRVSVECGQPIQRFGQYFSHVYSKVTCVECQELMCLEVPCE